MLVLLVTTTGRFRGKASREKGAAHGVPPRSPWKLVHGNLLGLVVVGGGRRRAVFWQAGGSRRLPEQDEARKGVAYRPGRARGVLGAGRCPRYTVNATSERAHGAPRPSRESSLG